MRNGVAKIAKLYSKVNDSYKFIVKNKPALRPPSVAGADEVFVGSEGEGGAVGIRSLYLIAIGIYCSKYAETIKSPKGISY